MLHLRWIRALSFVLCFAGNAYSAVGSKDALALVHHFVPHVSTVPPNAGRTVGLYVRERVMPQVLRQAEAKKGAVPIVRQGSFSADDNGNIN